jgi:uncharacterized membrane protein YbhN (UPF0104 family)
MKEPELNNLEHLSPRERSQTRQFIISLVIFLAVIILGVWFFYRHAEEFRKVTEIGVGSFIALSFLVILTIFVAGLEIMAIVRIFRTRLSVWEGFGLSALNVMVNFYFTKAGIAAKGIYLKKKHNFPYTQYLSTVGGAYVISLLVQGVLGVIFCLAIAPSMGLQFQILFAFVIVSLMGLAPFFIPKIKLKKQSSLFARIDKMLEGWHIIKEHRRMIAVLIAVNFCIIILLTLRLYVAFHSLGYDVGFWPCLVMAPLWTLSIVLSITPGSIGIRQVIFGYSSKLLGIGLTEGVLASTIDHAINALWVFIFGLLFSFWAWKKKKGSNTIE